MASQNFGVGSNSIEQNNGEARQRHMKTLKMRARFRNKVVVDESFKENGNKIHSNEQQEGQTSSISYPAHHQTFKRNELPPPPPHYHTEHKVRGDAYYRRYSTASYQPMFLPHLHMPLCYYPHGNTAIFPGFGHNTEQLRTPVTMPVLQENDDSDDVFVATGSGNAQNHMAFPAQVAVPIPYSPTLQQIQSRKRAHSAGDMIGLCLPANSEFTYPPDKHAQVTVDSNSTNSSYLQNSSIRPQHSAKVVSKFPVPSRKMFAMEVAESSNRPDVTSHITTRPVHNYVRSTNKHPYGEQLQMNQSSTDTSAQGQSNSGVHIQTAPTHKRLAKQTHSRYTNGHDAVAPTNVLSTTSQPLQPRITLTNKAQPSKRSSALKSSFSSRSLPVKKKVVWTDLAHQRKQTENEANSRVVPDEPVDESLQSLNIASIRANPSQFTEKNKIGPYFVGPRLGSCPVKSISQYLVRKSDTNKYYMAKILRMDEEEVKSGKMLLHTEHSLLSLLSSHFGVIQQHGMFKDCAYDEIKGKAYTRVGLILDCLTPHEFNSATQNYLNLQQYVIQRKQLNEQEAIRIFHSIVLIVESLHKSNVVHRDLKLGNMVYNKRTAKITLTNFCLGCHLTSERDLLTDQRGSPAYISPDVLSDKPYAGKPSDMWSLGVVLFTVLFGQFPFYDQEPKKLFAKIKAADYTIPVNGQVSENTNNVIRGLLTLDPTKRLTALDTLAALETCAAALSILRAPSMPAQVVPDVDDIKLIKSKKIEVESKEELTKAFELKMRSDDEDDGPLNLAKGARKCKRRTYDKLITSRISDCSPSSDFYRVQVHQIGANI